MKKGYFGEFGGCFVPELLMPPLLEVEAAMRDIMPTQQFQDELQDLLHNYAGRPTPLTFCPRLSEELGFELWLKREDLLHSGAHKINNTLGQALLAKYMGKTALVAETGAGQHGVATAVAAARLGMSCTIYMGAEDVERQAPNVMRMRLLGATVHPVESGSRTLKDAINEALRAWIVSQQTTHYCFGTAAGPHPFPTLVRMFQQVIGQEVREQMLTRAQRLPDAVVACVGGGSNAIGLFHPSWRTSACASSGWKPPVRASRVASIPRRSIWAAPACCTATVPCCSRTVTARSSLRTLFRPGWIIPAWGLSMPSCTRRAVCAM